MSKSNGLSAMEIDEEKHIGPKFQINVLQLLKFTQMQHGLRYSDYTRYRKYCTARLRLLYKSVKFLHGHGKFTRRNVTEATVTDVRESMESCNGEETVTRWT